MQGRMFQLWITCAVLALLPTAMPAVTIGHTNDFQDATTQGWIVGLLGAVHPAPPVLVPDGGPSGTGDAYLLLTSIGGNGAGSKMAVINLDLGWAGDYTAAGVNAIRMSLKNPGNSDLSIRLLLEDPMGGPPTNVAVTEPLFLPAGSDWLEWIFPIAPDDLTGLSGDVTTLLGQVTALRILHMPDPVLPAPAVAAQLAVDDITAAQVPEPASVGLLLGGLAALAMLRRGHGRAS